MAIAPPIRKYPAPPERRLWNRDEFARAEESGVFQPDERLELIEGDIIAKELPLRPPHANAMARTFNCLRAAFSQDFAVRNQCPLALGRLSEPMPDLAVVPGLDDDYSDDHPETAALIVEVAESSLRLDRNEKASLYARAGVTDYWILNLIDRTLEVHRKPTPDRAGKYGYRYSDVFSLSELESIAPLASSGVNILVADLLPRKHPDAGS